MTAHRLNEIVKLINAQNEEMIIMVETQSKLLGRIETSIKISLGQGFLENPESLIYSHLSTIDDTLIDIMKINDDILTKLKKEETL